MGWKPWDVDGATVPDFMVCFDGWKDYNVGPTRKQMTHGDLDKLMRQCGVTS